MKTAFSATSALPFALQFASTPAPTAVMEMAAGTISTVYCTDCGPSNSPDDGADTTTDDE